MQKEEEKINQKKNKKENRCFFCKNIIEKGLKKCPYCNKNQNIIKIIKLILISISLALITFLLLISRDIFTFNINSTIIKNNVSYKVTSVDFTRGEASWMGTPEEDNTFIIVSLAIKNNNKDLIEFDPDNWLLINSKNEIIERINYDYSLDSLHKSKIDDRTSIAKVVIYEVPISETKFKLRYQNQNDIKNEFQIRLY